MYIKDDPYASYKLLRAEFIKKGYIVNEEIIDDHRYASYVSPQGETWRTSVATLSYPCISKDAYEISRHKELAYDYAQQRGVAVPYTRTVVGGEYLEQDEVQTLIDEYGKLIVKPSNASLSRGLTLNITTHEMLNDAIELARMTSSTVLIQEQVEGEEVRFTVIDGKVQAALLRQTPRVIGDGVSTVAQLIAAENEDRKGLRFEYVSYPQLDASIIDPNALHDTTILKVGEVLELNRATMIKNGCSVYDVLDQVDGSYVEMVESLVRDLPAKFIVADVFIKDYKTPKQEKNHWFIEFNTSPVLKLYYACRDGKMFDIVPKLADSIDKGLQSGAFK
jgi:cyanophycin synthetase